MGVNEFSEAFWSQRGFLGGLRYSGYLIGVLYIRESYYLGFILGGPLFS